MAPSLVDMTSRGEKTYSYEQGSTTITVGFFDNVARYMAIARSTGPKCGFSPAEMASILSLNAPSGQWKKEISSVDPVTKSSKHIEINTPEASTYYTLSDPKLKSEVLGWEPGGKPFTFFFTPAWPGQQPIVLNEWQVMKSIG